MVCKGRGGGGSKTRCIVYRRWRRRWCVARRLQGSRGSHTPTLSPSRQNRRGCHTPKSTRRQAIRPRSRSTIRRIRRRSSRSSRTRHTCKDKATRRNKATHRNKSTRIKPRKARRRQRRRRPIAHSRRGIGIQDRRRHGQGRTASCACGGDTRGEGDKGG